MNAQLQQYYLKQPEPIQSCLLALKNIIMSVHEEVIHERKFQIPFFSYRGMKLGFLWVKQKKLLLGFVEDKRIHEIIPGIKPKDSFETIHINPNEDILVDFILVKLNRLIALYNDFER